MAQVALLEGMNTGKIIGEVGGKMTLFTNMGLRAFTYGQTYVGVEPQPKDGNWSWNSVLLYRESVEAFVNKHGKQSSNQESSNEETRENVKSVALALFRERIIQGVSEESQGAEAGAIWQAWRGGVRRPAERRVYESLAHFHKLLLFRAGRLDQESGAPVIEKIEKIIGNFAP